MARIKRTGISAPSLSELSSPPTRKSNRLRTVKKPFEPVVTKTSSDALNSHKNSDSTEEVPEVSNKNLKPNMPSIPKKKATKSKAAKPKGTAPRRNRRAKIKMPEPISPPPTSSPQSLRTEPISLKHPVLLPKSLSIDEKGYLGTFYTWLIGQRQSDKSNNDEGDNLAVVWSPNFNIDPARNAMAKTVIGKEMKALEKALVAWKSYTKASDLALLTADWERLLRAGMNGSDMRFFAGDKIWAAQEFAYIDGHMIPRTSNKPELERSDSEVLEAANILMDLVRVDVDMRDGFRQETSFERARRISARLQFIEILEQCVAGSLKEVLDGFGSPELETSRRHSCVNHDDPNDTSMTTIMDEE
ncbi:hypothetical protein MMC25_001883 [Agyrium rufum]|nr:hypothetical protein [Agyrium rufum]